MKRRSAAVTSSRSSASWKSTSSPTSRSHCRSPWPAACWRRRPSMDRPHGCRSSNRNPLEILDRSSKPRPIRPGAPPAANAPSASFRQGPQERATQHSLRPLAARRLADCSRAVARRPGRRPHAHGPRSRDGSSPGEGLADKLEFDTKADNEKIETTLFDSGLVDIQWRPKVAEGMVDTALTAKSTGPVRRPRGRPPRRLAGPPGVRPRLPRYLQLQRARPITSSSKSIGDNVRGWTAKPAADRQRIDVTLLKPAQGSETLTLHLARAAAWAKGNWPSSTRRSILVEGAALEQGEIAVRRSPRLDLRSLGAVGLSRADSGEQTRPRRASGRRGRRSGVARQAVSELSLR